MSCVQRLEELIFLSRALRPRKKLENFYFNFILVVILKFNFGSS
jgi:hypothetical protein